MDIAAWLRSLGLERYEPAFRENDIDAGLLPRLTREDLKELGVASLGHRRRPLDAIAALRGEPDGGSGVDLPPGSGGVGSELMPPRAW